MNGTQAAPEIQLASSQSATFKSIVVIAIAMTGLTAGLAWFASSSNPGLAVAQAELGARSALERYGMTWANVHVEDGTAIITGMAPGDGPRIIAYQAVRGALAEAINDKGIIKGIESRVVVAKADPPPARHEPVIALAETIPDETTPAETTPAETVPAEQQSPPLAQAEPLPEPVVAPEPAPAPAVVAIVETPKALDAPAATRVPVQADCKAEFSDILSKSRIVFGSDSAKISAESDAVLDQLAAVAKHCASFKVTVEGHTDITGRTAHNRDLSQKRAEAVRDALVARGVARGGIAAKGFGSSKPIAKGDSEAARAQNRRIEMIVSELTAR